LVKNAAAGASRAPTGRFDSPKNAAPSAWARKSLNLGFDLFLPKNRV
jgi:hypothetical protein